MQYRTVFQPLHWIVLLSLFLSLNLLFNLLLAAYGFIKSFEESLIKSLQNVTYVIFFFHCELTLIFFFLNAGSLLGLFEQWIETEKTLAGFNIRFGKKTMIKCWTFYVSTIIISTFDSLSTVFYVSMPEGRNSSDWKEFLENLGGVDSTLDLGSYKFLYNMIFVLTIVLSETAWIAGDVITTLVSILLYRYYEALHEKLSVPIPDNKYSDDNFNEFHRSIKVTSLLAKRVAETFSKLVVTTVICNTIELFHYLCLGLRDTKIDSNYFIIKFTLLYSFAYQVLRFFLSLYLTSLLTEKPAEIIDTLYQWPSLVSGFDNDDQRSRLIKLELIIDQVKSLSIDLAGDGFIRISKPTIASLCGFVITYLLLILQYNNPL